MNKIIHIILISLFSLTVFSCAKKEEEKKTEAPVLTEVYPVTTPTADPTPNYTFSSTKAGTITYGGSCSSGTTSATSGNNTITFLTLSEGTYSNCTIIVTDSDGNASNTLEVTTFIVNTTLYVAVGDSGTILTSSDNGISWNSMTSGTSKLLNDVTHGNSIFVTVGYGGTILTSSDNGTTWNDRSKTKRLWGVTQAYSTFMAVGNSGTIYTSSDGTTWTSRTSNTSKDLENVTYGNSTFVTVGSSGTILTSSDNGSTWTSRTSGTSNTLEGVTYSNNTFVTVGSSGTILTSSDNGTSWDNRTSGTTQNLHDVTYGNSTFVTVGGDGTILTSSDGTTWTSRTSGTLNYLEDVTYANGTFLTVGLSGTILTSSDGTTWTSRTSGTTNNLNGVTTTTTPLPAPDNLSASGANNTITLTWNSVSGANSYTLYWDNVSGIDSSDTAITSITNDNYTHSNMDNGSTYYYKVAAVNLSGTGTLSSVASALLSTNIQVTETFNTHTYALTSTSMSWYDARDNATALGGYLTTINTKAENDWLTATFFIKYGAVMWIGANDIDTENTWVWDNGTTSGDSGLTDDLCGTDSDCRDSNATWADGTEKWASGEPNDYIPLGGEDCGNIWRSAGTWNDLPCNNSSYFNYGIIEFD